MKSQEKGDYNLIPTLDDIDWWIWKNISLMPLWVTSCKKLLLRVYPIKIMCDINDAGYFKYTDMSNETLDPALEVLLTKMMTSLASSIKMTYSIYRFLTTIAFCTWNTLISVLYAPNHALPKASKLPFQQMKTKRLARQVF